MQGRLAVTQTTVGRSAYCRTAVYNFTYNFTKSKAFKQPLPQLTGCIGDHAMHFFKYRLLPKSLDSHKQSQTRPRRVPVSPGHLKTRTPRMA